MSTHPVRFQCRILHIGTADEHRLLQQTLLPDPRLALQHAPRTDQVIDDLRSRPVSELPNLILFQGPGDVAGSKLISVLKADNRLTAIPIVVLTRKLSEEENRTLYASGASCVITDSEDDAEMKAALIAFKEFWLSAATLPYCSDPLQG